MVIHPSEKFMRVERVSYSDVGFTVNPPYAFFQVRDHNKSKFMNGEIIVADDSRTAAIQETAHPRRQAILLASQDVVCRLKDITPSEKGKENAEEE